MIEIKTTEKHNAIGVNVTIEGVRIICAFEMKAIFDALEAKSPEIFHLGLEMFLEERACEDESED